MSQLRVLEEIRGRGAWIWADEGALILDVPFAADVTDLADRLRANKQAILDCFECPSPDALVSIVSGWPEVWQERFLERAAIKEIDANLTCREAELSAYRETLSQLITESRIGALKD